MIPSQEPGTPRPGACRWWEGKGRLRLLHEAGTSKVSEGCILTGRVAWEKIHPPTQGDNMELCLHSEGRNKATTSRAKFIPSFCSSTTQTQANKIYVNLHVRGGKKKDWKDTHTAKPGTRLTAFLRGYVNIVTGRKGARELSTSYFTHFVCYKSALLPNFFNHGFLQNGNKP